MNERQKALDKIKKLLNLANDKAAAPGEKENALEMAKRIASKYGFKIVSGSEMSNNVNPYRSYKRASEENGYNKYEFYVNCFNKKFIDFLFNLIGIKYYDIIDKNTIRIFVIGRKFDVDKFKKFYKKFVSVYYSTLKNEKKNSSSWDRVDTRWFHDRFELDFVQGMNSYSYDPHYKNVADLGSEFKSLINQIVKEV